MTDKTTQPTVLVKKSDGTYARMSLSELKAKQGGAKISPPAPKTAPAAAPVAVAKPAPLKKVNADFAAPLAEELAPAVNPGPKVSANRIDQVDAVIKKLNFNFPAHNLNRLRTIIQLRLKDVRSVEQTKDSLLRAELDGGMNLPARQAEEVLQKCAPPSPSAAETAEIVLPLKSAPAPKPARRAPPPAVRPEELPATSTPNNAFVHDRLRASGVPSPSLRAAPAPLSRGEGEGASVLPAQSFKLSSQPASKPILHDVVAKPMEMTPVDEVRYFNLVDFRRLAADPAEAARRLRQKFSNLKDESIVLYLQGLAAWRNSPLYLEYLDVVLSALNSDQKLPVPRDRKMLQWGELTAIVAMEQTMEYL